MGDIMNNKPVILIVDDEPINLQVLSRSLIDSYDIIKAGNGYEAIGLIKVNHPDLIILDVMMPDINGFDVCNIIKSDETFTDIPVIFLTALDTYENMKHGLHLGGVDYLTKPFDIDLLRLRVHNHIVSKQRLDLVKDQRDLLCQQKMALESALSRVKRLEGIIPICSYCKKIRDDNQSWSKLETYIGEHSDAVFSHGACPECAEEQIRMVKNMVLPR